MNHVPSPDNSDSAIEREIQAKGLTAPRVTMADIEANIRSACYFTAADPFKAPHLMEIAGDVPDPALGLLTFCVLVLHNGFTVTGQSACASPENFNAEIGKRIAREDAIRQVWPLLGYELKERLYQRTQPAQPPTGFPPTQPGSHASAVLYPAIEAAMKELDQLPATFNFTVNRAFNILHGAFWSESPAPASASPLRTAPV